MKKFALLSLLLAFSIPTGFADSHQHEHGKEKCTCTRECKDSCEKGQTKDCECKDCGCKEGKTCH